MQPDRVLKTVTDACELLSTAGEAHDGLFPAILTRDVGMQPPELPPSINGQRNGDRTFRGANLLYDQSTLRALTTLAEYDDRSQFQQAADRYLDTFANRCTHTPTGLFPWGEHLYWAFETQQPANSYAFEPERDHDLDTPEFLLHDHHRPVPSWLWDALISANPDCLHRFADGLDYHWRGTERQNYNRHANLVERERAEPKPDRACDFAVHGGYMIQDWARAYADIDRDAPRRHIERMLDYWDEHRNRYDILPVESYGRSDELGPGHNLMYATGLLTASEILAAADRAPAVQTTLENHANWALDGFLRAPHAGETGALIANCFIEDIEDGVLPEHEDEGVYPVTLWGSNYGLTGDIAAKFAVQLCAAYRSTGRRELLDLATQVGDAYRSNPFPADGDASTRWVEARSWLSGEEHIPIRAEDPGLVLGLYLDLAALTDADRWVAAAEALTETVLEKYFDEPLPRRAVGHDYYEAQLGPDILLYNLTRYGLLLRDGVDPGPDYSIR